jgi:superfamily II DNA helicase RecQ
LKDDDKVVNTVDERKKNDTSDHKSEVKRLVILNTETEAWVKHSHDANHLVIALKNLRKKLSAKEKVPAYMIFYNTTMAELCLYLPVTKSQLLTIKGMGEDICEKYGEKIIEVIKKYIDTILDDNFEVPEINVNEKHCFPCMYSTDDPRFVFCPICGNKLV